MWHAVCLTPMFCRPRRYVDLSKLARQQRHESPNIKKRFSVLFAPFSFALKEKGDLSRDVRENASLSALFKRFFIFFKTFFKKNKKNTCLFDNNAL